MLKAADLILKLGRLLAVLAIATSLATATKAQMQDEMTLMVYRGDTSIDVFVRGSTSAIEDAFGAFPTGLVSAEGKIDTWYLADKSWEIAQTMWPDSALRLNGNPVSVEATSFVLHPATDPLAFDTPYQAMLAIAACTLPPPERPTSIEDMAVYMGFITLTETPTTSVALNFNNAVSKPLRITVLEYAGNRLIQRQQIDFAKGQTVKLETTNLPHLASWSLLWLMVAATASVALACLVALALRRNKRVMPAG